MNKKLKKKIDNLLVKKFANYEIPDEIILSNKKFFSYKKKLSIEEIYKTSVK